jgi:hypothetical protein
MLIWQLTEPLEVDGVIVHYLNIFRMDAETKRDGGSRDPYFTAYFAFCDVNGKEIMVPNGEGGSVALGATKEALVFANIPQVLKDAHKEVKRIVFENLAGLPAGQVIEV